MNPENKQNVFKADKVFFKPVGFSLDLKELRTTKFTVTNTFKMSKLEKRAFMRLFGVKVPSLIHNGKKRRKR